jgi:hypothetical protein
MDNTRFDMSQCTILAPSEMTTVNVSDFRRAIEHIERIVSVDYHSAHPGAELLAWVERAKQLGSELIGLTCKRATAEDWLRRERAIDRSASLIAKAG